jgi:LuxR family transcriptional regulator, maltose regulon positive regulatory protein
MSEVGENRALNVSSGASPALHSLDLQPPPLRSGLVFRHQLVDLLKSTDAGIVTLTAPTGYGKTTTLAQWAGALDTPLAWLSLRKEDRNVKSFLFNLAASLRRVGMLTARDVSVFKFMSPSDTITHGTNQLSHRLADTDAPVPVVVDNADFLLSRASNEVVGEVLHQFEERLRFIFASNSRLRARMPALRASGRLLEITDTQLSLSVDETGDLISGLGLDPSLAADIVAATEGWPVATFLIALAARDGEVDIATTDIDDERHLSEFVRTEILPNLSGSRRDFLTLTSPLDRMSGPLCDAVVGTSGSHRLLESLETDTHLIRHLDGTGAWFATGRVIRNTLLNELERNDPDELAAVHRRAAAWFEVNEMPELAIEHAAAAKDFDSFARLMLRLIKLRYASGGVDVVLGWMRWWEGAANLEEHPDLAAMGALVHIQEGDALAAETWMSAATHGAAPEDAHPLVWMVRALGTRSGTDTMLAEIRKARGSLAPGSEWQSGVRLTEGLAHMWNDEFEAAEPLLAEASTLGERSDSWPATALALAERCLIAIGRRDWDAANSHASASLRIIDQHGLDGYVTSGLGLVVAARSARQRNDIAGAKKLLARSALVRIRLNSAMPGVAVQTLLEMAKAHVELSDVVAARILIREADEVILQRPDLGALPGALDNLKETVSLRTPGRVGPFALTKAELRLLPLLATHMSFPEIGELLFISRHTVKSQATSIYRKLGTSSRSEAMATAYEIGLLSH